MDILKHLHQEFGWFIWGMVGLAFIWFFTGGAQSETAHQGAYLKPPAPLDSGEAYGKYYAGTDGRGETEVVLPPNPSVFIKNTESKIQNLFIRTSSTEKPQTTSGLVKKLTFDGSAGAKNDAATEYIRIVANENISTPIAISGFRLAGNALDSTAYIPKATDSLILGVTGAKSSVTLPAGGRALIASGRSPIGTSFRENICTGYLDQFQTYTPALRKECPEPLDELSRAGLSSDSSCRNFVESLPRCRVYQGTLPAGLSGACKTFVTNKLTYNGCAYDHAKDKNFYKNEWRLFLDQSKELWRNKTETIQLIDDAGKTIDSLSY